ncbi:capsular polysaccharide transport system permease protein [Tranquillimonas rosea]|uniref:Capsular polysaccharide transport system permease protein n=1 Tax=Tranquillimonas rosea TaxID=641238 RepID=A0A1H9TVD9_9RHOB|nr:capsule biosynthesis protein [Tranquillimonas rosea]SES00991.1 capsular polysaccharide transport system permease protein [Tranquillimonas rosea]
MTTKPKARKFRIRRSSPLIAGERPESQADTAPAADAAPADKAAPTVPGGGTDTPRAGSLRERREAHGTGPVPSPAQDARVASPTQVSAESEIERIRKEGLTGRQLRMARRLAQKHGIVPSSDLDAVRQLRTRGIDPFERETMLQLVLPEDGKEPDPNLPQKVERPRVPAPETPRRTVPARQDDKVEMRRSRAQEISDIQRDIARRRRRKLSLLAVRLAVFIGLPTLVAGYYYHVVATPMYGTHTEFLIQKADNASASAGGMGGLLSGTSYATSQDSIAVQSYLQSRDAMIRLDRDVGFKSHFSQDWIDPIQRLPETASNEKAYDLYQDNVEIGYDPSEGIIKMDVVAADPEVSAEWSRQLVSYAEQEVDSLTQRLRADQMAGAEASFQDAETKMETAQTRVLELQEQLGVLDPASEQGGLMSQITTFETQLAEKRLQLQQLLDNRSPNEARVAGVRGDISRLQDLISNLRGQLTRTGGQESLASISGQLRMAETDLQTRTMMMQQALQQLETARIEANRQSRYLSMGVRPVPPDEPTYPRAFENTLLALLIFSGLYLMVSLTASILREQVSA